MRRDMARQFELDPALTHLNHGAFGAVPRTVRLAQERARAAVERAPTRAFRDELPIALGRAREAAATFVGVPADTAALVRNVSEGIAVVLQGLGIGPGDEVVVTDHGYPTVALAVQARGARVRTAPIALHASPADVATAVKAAVTARSRLVVLDQITSPTALVLPVADAAAAVAPVPVLVDAAHVPGALPGLEVEALGVDFWVGNLHKWSYAPRSAAVLWVAPRHRAGLRPLVTSWSDGEPFPARFDLQGTVDHSAWLAVPDGIAFWHELGGWEQVRRNTALLRAGADARARRARHGERGRRHTVGSLPRGRRPAARRRRHTGGGRGTLAAPVCRGLRRAAGVVRWSWPAATRGCSVQRRERLRTAGRDPQGPAASVLSGPPRSRRSMRPGTGSCGKIDRPLELPQGDPAP